MSSKFLLLLIGLLAVAEARNFLKKFNEKEQNLLSFATKSGAKVDSLVRRKRNTDDKTADSSEEPTSEEAAALLKFFINVAWQGDKKEVLSGFLDEVSDTDTNLTVVGWQRILDGEGNVKEIRTVQLVIPPKPFKNYPGNIVLDDDDDDDIDSDGNERLIPYGAINELKEIFGPLASLGIPASVTFEGFSKDGNLEGLIYMNKDELYVHSKRFSIYNKTSVASSQEVADFITSLKPAALGKPSILKYDVDGSFLVEQSNVKPQLLGRVAVEYEAPENILTASPQIIAQISQQYPQEAIPKELATYYNKHFPEYRWRVLVDPANYHITKDVSVTLQYDNFDLDENSYIEYLVYGVKKDIKK